MPSETQRLLGQCLDSDRRPMPARVRCIGSGAARSPARAKSRMSKIVGLAAVVLLIALAAAPARADCPDGYCDDGSIVPGSLADRHEKQEAARRRQQDQCVDACEQVCSWESPRCPKAVQCERKCK